MKEDSIKRLLDRYYRGISTAEEEIELRQYFLDNELPGHEAEKILFTEYANISVISEPSEGFERKIFEAVENNDKSRIVLKKEPGPLRRVVWMNVAALILTLVGLYLFITNFEKQIDTYDDPEIAYIETVKILNRVSNEINRGMSSLDPVTKVHDRTYSSISSVNSTVSVITKNFIYSNY